jgi:hypothetical protein
MIDAEAEQDYIDALAAIKHLEQTITRAARLCSATILYRDFPMRGPQYKFANGPYRDTLMEAINAHALAHARGEKTNG